MTPFSREFRRRLLGRFLELVRPARASQIYLIDAVGQCDSARQAGAHIFASQLFQEASLFLHCATDEFQHCRFEEGKVLARLAHQRATEARTIADMAKSVSRDNLRQQLYATLVTLGEVAHNMFRSIENVSTSLEMAREQFHKALGDSRTAFQALNEDDYSTARAHLGYARAMTERLASSFHDRPFSETMNNRRRRSIPEAFDQWFMKRVEELDRQLAFVQEPEAAGPTDMDTLSAHRELRTIAGTETRLVEEREQ